MDYESTNKNPREHLKYLQNLKRNKERQLHNLEHEIDELGRAIKALSKHQ